MSEGFAFRSEKIFKGLFLFFAGGTALVGLNRYSDHQLVAQDFANYHSDQNKVPAGTYQALVDGRHISAHARDTLEQVNQDEDFLFSDQGEDFSDKIEFDISSFAAGASLAGYLVLRLLRTDAKPAPAIESDESAEPTIPSQQRHVE